MRLKGEGEYFRGILVFLLFSGLLEMSEKVTVCLATHFLSFFLFPFLFFYIFCIHVCHAREPTPPVIIQVVAPNWSGCFKTHENINVGHFKLDCFSGCNGANLVLQLK